MASPKNQKGTGAAFIGVGIAFLTIASSGQTYFLGVGMTFIALGIGFLVRSRRTAKP